MMGKPASRGVSMVELLVGTAVGLAIVAAASAVVTHQMRENRAVLVEARLMQDLRNAADVVARDLRRAGYWGSAASGIAGDSGSAVVANPYGVTASGAAASSTVRFGYSRDAVENNVLDANEQFGFRLRNGAIDIELGAGNWQALTDPATLVVTAFQVVAHVDETTLADFCAEPCASGSLVCPPRQQVHSFALVLSGRAAADAAVTRSLRSSVKVRNTSIVGSCEG